MKRKAPIVLLIFMMLLSVSLCGCRNEKDLVGEESLYASYEKDDILTACPIILKGIVLEKGRSEMYNPDNSRKSEEGYLISNFEATEFIVEVEEIYKGVYDQKTIAVKTVNGEGLSPELILYGEDETSRLEEPLDRFELTTGEEYILCLSPYRHHEPEFFSGYYVSKEETFAVDSLGRYKNNQEEFLEPATIKQEIAAAVAKKETSK